MADVSKITVSECTPVKCADCSLSTLCLPVGIDLSDLDLVDQIVQRGRPLKKGQHLFRSADPFSSIYAVRSGCIKTYLINENGTEQITGFYLPGEIFGTDGISSSTHINFAKATETTSVCEIPFADLEALSGKVPGLQRHFFQIMSKEIQSDKKMMLLLGQKNSDEKIASFLLSLSARYRARGLSAGQYRLPMARGDLANYLGLAQETISRVFAKYQRLELIEAQGREIKILDLDKLSTYTGGGS